MPTPPFSVKLAYRLASELRKEAYDRRETAGCNGEYGDRGASALEAEVSAFLCGIDNRWPAHWLPKVEAMVKTMEREADPEYETYMRLKTKFGD